MPQRWTVILLPLVILAVFFAACKKQFSTDAPLTPVYTPSIIINSDNQILYGINPANGVKNWQVTLGAPKSAPVVDFQTSPLIYGGMIYLPGNLLGYPGDTLYKINAATGKIVARTRFIQPLVGLTTIQATPIAYKNLIILPMINDTIYAVDSGTLVTKWKYSPGASQDTLISSPTIYHDTLYEATSSGYVFALDMDQTPAVPGGTISANWQYQASLGFVSSPSISAPYLFVGSKDSNMYCIPLVSASAPGNTTRWTYRTHGSIYSSPATDAGLCVFGSTDNNVYCLDTFLEGAAVTPRARWIQPTTSAIWSSPAISGNVVFIGSFDYYLYALNIIDGSVKWRYKTTGLIKSSPLVYGGLVYISSFDKNLYALDTSLGTERWIYNTNGQIECSPAVYDLNNNDQNNSQISGFTQ